MNILKKSLLLFPSLFLLQKSNAQEGMAVYTDYLTDNYYLVHPSMAGAASCAKVRLTMQNQWLSQKESPALQTLSFNTRIAENSGVGVIAYNDRNGYHSQMGAKLTYAHHLNFSPLEYDLNQLSFGLSAGMSQTVLDETTWNNGATFDPVVVGGLVGKDINFNVDAGASYHYFDFYSHFTVKNLLETKNDLYSDVENNNRRRYLLTVGYVFGNEGLRYNSSTISWEPSVMVQYLEATKESRIDASVKMYKDFEEGQFFAGLSYGTALQGAEYKELGKKVKNQYFNLLTPILGVKYKNMMLGYTYSHQLGGVLMSNGFHQLTLGFNFLCNKAQTYKCSCPSVNY